MRTPAFATFTCSLFDVLDFVRTSFSLQRIFENKLNNLNAPPRLTLGRLLTCRSFASLPVPLLLVRHLLRKRSHRAIAGATLTVRSDGTFYVQSFVRSFRLKFENTI